MVEFCPYRSLTEALRYSSLVERARWQEFDGYLAAKLGGRSRLGLLNTDSRATGKPARPFYSVVSKRKKHGNGTGRFREGNGRLNLGEQIHGS